MHLREDGGDQSQRIFLDSQVENLRWLLSGPRSSGLGGPHQMAERARSLPLPGRENTDGEGPRPRPAWAQYFMATQGRDPQRTPERRSGQSCRRRTGERESKRKRPSGRSRVQTRRRNHVREDWEVVFLELFRKPAGGGGLRCERSEGHGEGGSRQFRKSDYKREEIAGQQLR